MPVRRSARLALQAKKAIIPEKALKKALKFPPELRDIILDQLWDLVRIRCHDPDTLRSCTLVNKDWYASARPHVFRTVRLNSWRRLVELAELAVSDRRITRYIRKVYLYGASSANGGDSIRDFVKADDSWILQFPFLLGGSLPSLQSIEICNFAYPVGNYEEQDSGEMQRAESERFATWIYSLRTLKNVEELILRDCMMSSNALTALIRSFRRLNRVELREIILNTHGDLAAIPIHEAEGTHVPTESHARNNGSYISAELPVVFPLSYPRPKLQSVYIHYSFDEPFDINTLQSWFLPRDVTATLKSLGVFGNLEVEPLVNFFSNFGLNPVLESLIHAIDPELHFDIDLSPFLHLRRISFSPGWFHAESVSGLIHMLSRLTTPTRVVELTFVIELMHLDGLRYEDVGPIDDLLSSEKFKHLEVVTVVHDYHHPPRQLWQAAMQAFPILSRRGILDVMDLERALS